MKPKVVSLFAGIGGFDLGLERAGFEVVRQVEIDAYCLKVLEKHWPHVDRGTDVRKEESEAYAERYGAISLICGGFPCQDLSVAGKRAGLAGERSGLFYELLRVADSNPASWVLAENVPGLLSSAGGADFATVLGELSGFFPEVPADGWRNSGVCSGPKGTVAWRVLDAQYFGVAQRRRRVFIVRSPATCRSGAFQVLFESESVSGNPAPSREEGQGIARCLTKGARMDGDTETFVTSPDGSRRQSDVSPTLDARVKDGPRRNQGGTVIIQDGGRASDKAQNGLGITEDGPCYTLDGVSQHAVSVAPTLSTKNEVASSSTQRWKWMEQSAEMMGAVRRLTPTECERLQGFPDGWTLLGDKTPDSPRYKACGNAVCVNVAEWIGRRLMSVISEEAKL